MTTRILRRFLPVLAVAILSGCGKKEAPQVEGEIPRQEPYTPDTEPAPAADPGAAIAARQQALVDQAIALLGGVADAAISVEDAETAKVAAASIDAIDSQFRELSAQMEQAGSPTAELVTKFRKQYNQASETVGARINRAMPDLGRQPEIAQLLNQLFDRFSKTLEHPVFKSYGIDGS